MKILRIAEVSEITGLSPSSIYKQVRLGLFPKQVKLTSRATGWNSKSVEKWVSNKLQQEVSDERN